MVSGTGKATYPIPPNPTTAILSFIPGFQSPNDLPSSTLRPTKFGFLSRCTSNLAGGGEDTD
jgi:hypothetical protein